MLMSSRLWSMVCLQNLANHCSWNSPGITSISCSHLYPTLSVKGPAVVGRPVVKWMGGLMLMRHAREGGYVTDIYRAELKMWSKATIMFQESGENMQELY